MAILALPLSGLISVFGQVNGSVKSSRKLFHLFHVASRIQIGKGNTVWLMVASGCC